MEDNLMSYATGIQHIGIPTEDLEESKKFYRGLGFEVYHEKVIRDGTQHVCFLKFNNLILEVYEEAETKKMSGAIDHFAIDVDNIDACFALCQKQGYQIVSNDIEQLPFYDSGVRFFIITGVNQERIEFNEIL